MAQLFTRGRLYRTCKKVEIIKPRKHICRSFDYMARVYFWREIRIYISISNGFSSSLRNCLPSFIRGFRYDCARLFPNMWTNLTLIMRQALADDSHKMSQNGQKWPLFGISWPYLESPWEIHSNEYKHVWFWFIPSWNRRWNFEKIENANRLLLRKSNARVLSVNLPRDNLN